MSLYLGKENIHAFLRITGYAEELREVWRPLQKKVNTAQP